MRRSISVALTLALGVVVGSPASAHDHRPPKTVLRSHDARQKGNLGTYCWSFERGGECADTAGYGFPFAQKVKPGATVRIRIRRNHRPEETDLHAWRHVDEDRQPQGDGWGVSHRVKKRRWGDRTVYDIVFRAPEKGEHVYLELHGRWQARRGKFGAGGAYYNYHLRLN